MTFSRGNLGASKLTGEEVLQIRERYGEGESQGSLARAFGISINQIGRIVRGESWQANSRAAPRGRWPAVEASPEEIQTSLEKVLSLSKEAPQPDNRPLDPYAAAKAALQEPSGQGLSKLTQVAEGLRPKVEADKAVEELLNDGEKHEAH